MKSDHQALLSGNYCIRIICRESRDFRQQIFQQDWYFLNFHWFLQQCVDPVFDTSLLFIDEANFNKDGIINFHSNHLWAEENPHNIVQSWYQQQFPNVWAGIIGDHLIGPYFLPARLNGEAS